MTLHFHLKHQPVVPLEAEVLTPDVISKLTVSEIGELIVYHGKRQVPLKEFFDIEGEPGGDLVIHGSLHKVRWIGRGMTHGTVTVHGSVGMHLGAYMKGGRIEVFGDATDWIGAEMKNGTIHVHGNAGGQIGAAYRGALRGMTNGTIVIDGSAGLEVGMRMRRGTIIVGGPTRDFTGLQMKGGTIILMSGAEIRTGAWMNRGTIISMKPLTMMPTFAESGCYVPSFVNLYSEFAKQYGVQLPTTSSSGHYQRYAGDLSVPGKGEILVWQPA